MGATGSKDAAQEGIITVVPAAADAGRGANSSSSSRGPSPLPFGGSITSRPGSRANSRAATPCDPLMQHLLDLQTQGAKLQPALLAPPAASATNSTRGNRTSTASGALGGTAAAVVAAAAAAAAARPADADSLLSDLATAQQLSSDTQRLQEAISAMLATYQATHNEQMTALIANQEYITRTMDQAESKAGKAVRHVQQETTKLRQLSSGLRKAAELPALLQQLTADTDAMEAQLQLLEQRAAAATSAAAAGGGGTGQRR